MESEICSGEKMERLTFTIWGKLRRCRGNQNHNRRQNDTLTHDLELPPPPPLY